MTNLFQNASGCWKSILQFLTNTLGLTPRSGLFGITMSIRLNDFLRARKKDPEAVASTVTEICASETLGSCFNWGRLIGAHWYHLYFDQGEPFYGHVYDRKHNKKARKEIAFMKKVSVLEEADMRTVPALQAADLFAWSFNHFEKATREWHKTLNALPWQSVFTSITTCC